MFRRNVWRIWHNDGLWKVAQISPNYKRDNGAQRSSPTSPKMWKNITDLLSLFCCPGISLLDAGATAAFFLMVAFCYWQANILASAVGSNTLQVSDFSVILVGLPSDSHAKEVRLGFDHVVTATGSLQTVSTGLLPVCCP